MSVASSDKESFSSAAHSSPITAASSTGESERKIERFIPFALKSITESGQKDFSYHWQRARLDLKGRVRNELLGELEKLGNSHPTAEIAKKCKEATRLILTHQQLSLQIQYHIELVNSVFRKGILSPAKAHKSALTTALSIDEVSAPIDKVRFNVIPSATKDIMYQGIRSSLHSMSRGGLSVALEQSGERLLSRKPKTFPTSADYEAARAKHERSIKILEKAKDSGSNAIASEEYQEALKYVQEPVCLEFILARRASLTHEDLTKAQELFESASNTIKEAKASHSALESNEDYQEALKYASLEECLDSIFASKQGAFKPTFSPSVIASFEARLKNTILVVTSFPKMENQIINLEDQRLPLHKGIELKANANLGREGFESYEESIYGSLHPDAIERIIVPRYLKEYQDLLPDKERIIFIGDLDNVQEDATSIVYYLDTPLKLKHPNYEPILAQLADEFSDSRKHMVTHMMRCTMAPTSDKQ